jgi:hypothetical protein
MEATLLVEIIEQFNNINKLNNFSCFIVGYIFA